MKISLPYHLQGAAKNFDNISTTAIWSVLILSVGLNEPVYYSLALCLSAHIINAIASVIWRCYFKKRGPQSHERT